MSQAGGSSGSSGTGDDGFKWYTVTAPSVQATVNTGYITNGGSQVVITLPAVSKPGDGISVVGTNVTGWKIAQNAGNQIFFLSTPTTSGTGGYIQSTQTYNTLNLICVTTNANWVAQWQNGNLTVH